MVSELTQEYLKECVHYNPDTGVVTWLTRPREHFKSAAGWGSFTAKLAGKVAGCVYNTGYLMITINKKRLSCHRLAWLYMTGSLPTGILDHIDGDKLNNRIANLREATHLENLQNRSTPNADNTTGYLGVTLPKYSRKYRSQIMVNSKPIHLGMYDTAEEASEAYLKAKKELHPFNVAGGMVYGL